MGAFLETCSVGTWGWNSGTIGVKRGKLTSITALRQMKESLPRKGFSFAAHLSRFSTKKYRHRVMLGQTPIHVSPRCAKMAWRKTAVEARMKTLIP